MREFPDIIFIPSWWMEYRDGPAGTSVLGARMEFLARQYAERMPRPAQAGRYRQLSRVRGGADGSGTTFNFTDYLSKVSADWKSKVGSGTAVEWPAGVGAKGNEGVSGNIGQTKNAIGYVEYAYAKQNKLTYTALVNKAGKTMQPTTEAFQAAASNADWAHAPGYYLILTDQPGDKSWPIVASTFILMHKESADKAASAGGDQVLQVGFRQGRQDGRRARLHPDAGTRWSS